MREGDKEGNKDALLNRSPLGEPGSPPSEKLKDPVYIWDTHPGYQEVGLFIHQIPLLDGIHSLALPPCQEQAYCTRGQEKQPRSRKL